MWVVTHNVTFSLIALTYLLSYFYFSKVYAAGLDRICCLHYHLINNVNNLLYVLIYKKTWIITISPIFWTYSDVKTTQILLKNHELSNINQSRIWLIFIFNSFPRLNQRLCQMPTAKFREEYQLHFCKKNAAESSTP